MLSKRRMWLERIANWGTALAVPLVAVVGFKLLAHARDAARPVVAPPGASAVPARGAGRVLAPPIDASAPPVVELKPAAAPAAVEPRCAELARIRAEADAAAARPGAADAATRRERGRAALAEARSLGCAPR